MGGEVRHHLGEVCPNKSRLFYRYAINFFSRSNGEFLYRKTDPNLAQLCNIPSRKQLLLKVNTGLGLESLLLYYFRINCKDKQSVL